MAAIGLLISFYRDRGLTREPRRPTRFLTRHDTLIVPRAKFYDEAGVAISLTGKTVRYSLRDLVTNMLVVNRQTATNENQTTNAGEAYYSMSAGQKANALAGFEEWELDHGSGMIETFPAGLLRQLVIIHEDVDAA